MWVSILAWWASSSDPKYKLDTPVMALELVEKTGSSSIARIWNKKTSVDFVTDVNINNPNEDWLQEIFSTRMNYSWTILLNESENIYVTHGTDTDWTLTVRISQVNEYNKIKSWYEKQTELGGVNRYYQSWIKLWNNKFAVLSWDNVTSHYDVYSYNWLECEHIHHAELANKYIRFYSKEKHSVELAENRFLIVYPDNTDLKVYASILTFSDTDNTFSFSDITTIYTATTWYPSLVKVNETKYIVAYSWTDNDWYVRTINLDAWKTTISSIGTEFEFDGWDVTYSSMEPFPWDETRILLASRNAWNDLIIRIIWVNWDTLSTITSLNIESDNITEFNMKYKDWYAILHFSKSSNYYSMYSFVKVTSTTLYEQASTYLWSTTSNCRYQTVTPMSDNRFVLSSTYNNSQYKAMVFKLYIDENYDKWWVLVPMSPWVSSIPLYLTWSSTQYVDTIKIDESRILSVFYAYEIFWAKHRVMWMISTIDINWKITNWKYQYINDINEWSSSRVNLKVAYMWNNRFATIYQTSSSDWRLMISEIDWSNNITRITTKDFIWTSNPTYMSILRLSDTKWAISYLSWTDYVQTFDIVNDEIMMWNPLKLHWTSMNYNQLFKLKDNVFWIIFKYSSSYVRLKVYRSDWQYLSIIWDELIFQFNTYYTRIEDMGNWYFFANWHDWQISYIKIDVNDDNTKAIIQPNNFKTRSNWDEIRLNDELHMYWIAKLSDIQYCLYYWDDTETYYKQIELRWNWFIDSLWMKQLRLDWNHKIQDHNNYQWKHMLMQNWKFSVLHQYVDSLVNAYMDSYKFRVFEYRLNDLKLLPKPFAFAKRDWVTWDKISVYELWADMKYPWLNWSSSYYFNEKWIITTTLYDRKVWQSITNWEFFSTWNTVGWHIT